MTITIDQLSVQLKRLSSAEAELQLLVQPSARDSRLQLCGRLVGPRCETIQTIQIAYPIRQLQIRSADAHALVGRIQIPEPNLWTPETPYMYEGTVELWLGEECLDSRPIKVRFPAKPEVAC